jgi:CheY-like chemotaxis protein
MTAAAPLILLLDDDADFVEINRHILEAAGYRIACVYDPEEALASMARERPDLVISDLMMTSFDSGFSFAARVKADPRFAAVPVVIVTAVTSQLGLDFRPHSPADLAAMHADAFFDKPVPAQSLLAKVRELLKQGH